MFHEKCIETNDDMHIALLQIRSTPLEFWLPSPAMLLFNCPIQGIMSIINGTPINSNNDEGLYEALVKKQTRNDRNFYVARNYDLFSIGSTVTIQ